MRNVRVSHVKEPTPTTASNTYDMCTCTECCRCCCCCLLLLFVIVHLPPEVILRTNSSCTAYCQSFCVANENSSVHPLAVHSLWCGLGFYLYSYLSWPLRALAEPQAGVSHRYPGTIYWDTFVWYNTKYNARYMEVMKLPISETVH